MAYLWNCATGKFSSVVEIKDENSAPISCHSLSLAHLLTSSVGVFGVECVHLFSNDSKYYEKPRKKLQK